MKLHHITFMRHAESNGNVGNILQGRSDTTLSSRGLEQAHQRAITWKNEKIHFERIISSPLKRAYQTAEIIAKELSTPLEVDPNWQERDFGSLEGKPLPELRQSGTDFFEPYLPLGDTGESQVDMYQRALSAIQDLVRRPPGRYLIVSHGAFLARVMFVVLGITPQSHYNSPVFWMGNTSYINMTYSFEKRQWRWFGFNNPDEWAGLEE